MNSLFLLFSPVVYTTLQTLIPLTILSAVVSIDVAIRPTSSKPDRYDRALTALAFLLFPLMVFLPYYESRTLTSSYLGPNIGVITLVGVAILLVGSFLLMASRIQIGHFGGPRITIEDDHRLITDRMYRYIRNPQYLGFLLLFAGYSFSLGSLFVTVVIVVGLFAVFRSRILLEEQILLETFGDEYAEYMRKTWRLVPYMY